MWTNKGQTDNLRLPCNMNGGEPCGTGTAGCCFHDTFHSLQRRLVRVHKVEARQTLERTSCVDSAMEERQPIHAGGQGANWPSGGSSDPSFRVHIVCR